MKFKTTKKAIRENYNHVIKTGYCEIQYLLMRENPIAYNVGKYGWNCDIYDCSNKYKGVAISTGYAPFGDIVPSYDLCKKYDKYAETILYGDCGSYEEKQEKLENLIDEFIEECLKLEK